MATVRALVVGGGGGGGGGGGTNYVRGGGGGAGGMKDQNITMQDGFLYPVIVGRGGIVNNGDGFNGGDSSVGVLVSVLGGGAGKKNADGSSGGSGGGGAGDVIYSGGAGTPGQGKDGGGCSYQGYGGGGGGAGQVGGIGTNDGRGGDGLASDITGVNTYYAGGGGNYYTGAGGNGGGGGRGQGADGFGGGGGGGSSFSAGANGYRGGHGVVILRYLRSEMLADGGVKTEDGLYNVHTFLEDGTFSVLGIATCTTKMPTNIESTKALLNGEVLTGFPFPDYSGFVLDTVSRAKPGDIAPQSTLYKKYVFKTNELEFGDFSRMVTNLEPETTYYVRTFVKNSYGYSYSTNELTFTTLALPPKIESLDPAGASLNETKAFTIYGNGFQSGLTLEIDGLSCTSVVVVDENTITAVCPSSSVQKRSILIVENTDGQSDSASFFYVDEVPEPTPPASVSAEFTAKSIGFIT